MIALPTNRDENWRYANLRPLAKARVEAIAADAPRPDSLELPASLPGFQRWVFVDGRLATGESSNTVAHGVRVLETRDVDQAFLAQLDDSIANAGVDFALARINAARGDQVFHLQLAEGTVAALELVFVATSAAANGTSYPRVQLHVGRHAKLRLVERHISTGAVDPAVNSALDVAIAADGQAEHTRIQRLGAGASCFDTLAAHVGERASYSLRTVTLGGLSSRSTQFISLAGTAARCELTAAALADGNQTHDLFAEIEHAAPRTVTRELFRGIAGGRGKLAFNGKIIVRAEAHESDSEQSLKTLLTGNGAEANARPQLQIHTDRVRAAHGATTGKLDEQMLFYLLSRGIEPAIAQALLQWAFIEAAVSRLAPAELREDVEKAMAARLSEVASLDGLLGKP